MLRNRIQLGEICFPLTVRDGFLSNDFRKKTLFFPPSPSVFCSSIWRLLQKNLLKILWKLLRGFFSCFPPKIYRKKSPKFTQVRGQHRGNGRPLLGGVPFRCANQRMVDLRNGGGNGGKRDIWGNCMGFFFVFFFEGFYGFWPWCFLFFWMKVMMATDFHLGGIFEVLLRMSPILMKEPSVCHCSIWFQPAGFSDSKFHEIHRKTLTV